LSERIAFRDDVSPILRHRVFGVLGLRKPIVQLTVSEQDSLTRWAAGRKHAVELGVAEGGSAHLIASVLHPSGTLWLVDPFFPGALRVVGLHELIARRLLRASRPTTRFLKMLSWHAPTQVALPPIDFLFVDADHTEDAVRRDWHAWSPLLAADAVVVFHDAVDPTTNELTVDGPGPVVRDAISGGWRCLETTGALAVIGRDS
jgi:hypothetical protein